MRVLITGAGGFVGSHVFEHFLATTDYDVVATDSFRHKGRNDRIARILAEEPATQGGDASGVSYRALMKGRPGGRLWRERVTVLTHDLAAPFTRGERERIGKIDLVVAMASESHVDRSLADPVPFVRNNVDVILNTLEYCRQAEPAMVLMMSTDEVYGPVFPGQAHAEWAPIIPSNPYAASKAAQEAIAISYWRAFGLPLVIVNGMNLFGEMQDMEKFLPMTIAKVRDGETLQIHGTPGNIGSRHYLHARNLADAMLHIWLKRPASPYQPPVRGAVVTPRPDRYNIAGPHATSNLELASMVAAIMERELHYELVDFHSARPGHDPHYGLDPKKLKLAGWTPPVDFAASLEKTVRWTLKHPEWLLEG